VIVLSLPITAPKEKNKKINTYLCLLLHLLTPPINQQIPFSLPKKNSFTLINLSL